MPKGTGFNPEDPNKTLPTEFFCSYNTDRLGAEKKIHLGFGDLKKAIKISGDFSQVIRAYHFDKKLNRWYELDIHQALQGICSPKRKEE